MKFQIALDYLMVFAFVFLIFVLIVASIAKQRALVTSEQTFSQLQLVSEAVAGDLSSAAEAGNGYSATILLPPQLSVLTYNISITRGGLVLASANVFGQLIQTTAVSLVQNVVSNSIYLSQNKQYYVIPTIQSTGYITLQNSFGTICIDYTCPSTSNQSGTLTLTDQIARALQFNGYTTNALYPNAVTQSPIESVSFWVKPAQLPTLAAYLIDQGNSLMPNNNLIEILPSGAVWGGPAPKYACGSSLDVVPNKWYFITYTVSSNMNIYINGNVMLGCTTSGVADVSPLSLNVGQRAGGQPGSLGARFNGSITNLQIYNIQLSSQQVQTLYQEGITGYPVDFQGNYFATNVVAWYPFSGNPNDYSGQSHNLVLSGVMPYTSVGEITAAVGNNTGIPLQNVSVGFTTGSGTFTTGQSASNATNSNGIAYMFVSNQGLNSTIADVRATAFNGNSFTKGNVVAWWPMSDGQGRIMHDVSNFSNTYNAFNGNMVNAFWASPNYAAQFDGQTSLIQLSNTVAIQSAQTVNVWVNLGSAQAAQNVPIVFKSGAWGVGSCGFALCILNPQGLTWYGGNNEPIFIPGKWYMVTVIAPNQGGHTTQTFVNGKETNGFCGIAGLLCNVGLTQSYAPQIGYGSLGANSLFFNGSIANLQIYDTYLTQAEISQLYQEGLSATPVDTSIAGWWPLDGDVLDYSANGNNGVIYGNLQMAPLQAQQNQKSQILSGSFDGATSSVSAGYDGNIMPTSNIVISAWIKTGSSNNEMIAAEGVGALKQYGYVLELLAAGALPGTSSGYPAFTVYGTSGSCTVYGPFAFLGAPSLQLNDNQWHYIAATYAAQTETATLFIDGSQVAASGAPLTYCTGSIGPGNNVYYGGASVQPIFIGQGGGSNYFNGYISDVQVYNSILTNTQLIQLYQEGLGGLPLQNSRISGWFPLNGDGNDYSSFSYPTTTSNLAYYSQSLNPPITVPSLNGAGLYFDGIDSNVIVKKTVPINGQFTAAAWINPNIPNGNGAETVVGIQNLFDLGVNDGGRLEGDLTPLGTLGSGTVQTQYSLNTGQWYLLAATYNGLAMTLYLNGLPVNTIAASGTVRNTNPTVIGSTEASPYLSKYYNGTIADVQIYNVSLNNSQMYQLYNAGTPPSASLQMPLGVTP